jgi:hypothetical protein
LTRPLVSVLRIASPGSVLVVIALGYDDSGPLS